MKYLQRTSLVYFCLIFLALYQRTTTNPEARLKFAEYCAYHAYPTETHIFQTQDGYNLKFFRLQGNIIDLHSEKPNNRTKRKSCLSSTWAARLI